MNELIYAFVWKCRKYPRTPYEFAQTLWTVDDRALSRDAKVVRNLPRVNAAADAVGQQLYAVHDTVHGYVKCNSYQYDVAASLITLLALCAHLPLTGEVEQFIQRLRMCIEKHPGVEHTDTFLDWVKLATANTKEGTAYVYLLTLPGTVPEIRKALKTELDGWGTPV